MSDLDVEDGTAEEIGRGGSEGDNYEYSFLDQEPEPCNNFRLDTTRSFGMCKCGHPKSAHGAKGENKAAVMLSRLKHNNDHKNSVDSNTSEMLVEPGNKACNKFRLDTTASEFGMCKCGFKRIEHVGQKDDKAKKALEQLKESNLDKYRNSIDLKKGVPCDNYRVDITASEFGVCLCGFKKDDHAAKDENAAAKMLKNLKEKNIEKHNKEDKEAIQPAEQQKELPEVKELTNAEQEAKNAIEQKQENKKKQKKGCCIVS